MKKAFYTVVVVVLAALVTLLFGIEMATAATCTATDCNQIQQRCTDGCGTKGVRQFPSCDQGSEGGCAGQNPQPCICEERPSPTPPTPIELISFIATPSADGSVTLAWETGTEVDNAGFNLYRATDAVGAYAKINGTLIPAQGNPVAGGSYSFSEIPGPGTFHYILTDVALSGEITLYGPVMVEVPEQ